MFSREERCVYQNNQLFDVICQFRFPEVLVIQTQLPDAFQEQVRQEFPRYSRRLESSPFRAAGKSNDSASEHEGKTVNHQFLSADGRWRLNLTGKFLSLSCNRYTCWKDFAVRLDMPLAAFIRIYRPAYFERVGLRYVNFISRKALGLEGVPFRDLIKPTYLGPLADEEIAEQMTVRCSVDTDIAIRNGCRVKIHAGPGMLQRAGIREPEVKFVFDQDLYQVGNIPVDHSVHTINSLHTQAYPIFRGAISDLLHDAMEPI